MYAYKTHTETKQSIITYNMPQLEIVKYIMESTLPISKYGSGEIAVRVILYKVS